MAEKKTLVKAGQRKLLTSTDKARTIGLTTAKRRELVEEISKLHDFDIADIVTRVGVGDKFHECHMCGVVKREDEFYITYDKRIMTGKVCICKSCAEQIANGVDLAGNAHGVTSESVKAALEYMDLPYVESIYEAAENDKRTSRGSGSTAWKSYMKFIYLNDKYKFMRFHDSDGAYARLTDNTPGYSTRITDDEREVSKEEAADNQEQYEINRRDTVKFCGYDPFVNESPDDKPRLYAKLVGFLDDQAKEDPFKLSSIIEIVKGLSQSEKLNDEITNILNDKANFMANGPLLNKMMDTRKKCMDTVQTLARDNGISINYNKNSSAGQQTLSGRIKKVTEENLREGRVNAFDVGTCEGMKQIAEISEAARAKQLGMSEDVLREIKDTSTALVTSLTRERDEYMERYRILLRENLDLKEYLRDQGLIDEHNVVIDGG